MTTTTPSPPLSTSVHSPMSFHPSFSESVLQLSLGRPRASDLWWFASKGDRGRVEKRFIGRLRLSGAVHKVRHAIFGQFRPLSLCHTLSHIPGPPKITSHISNPRFLVGLVKKTGK